MATSAILCVFVASDYTTMVCVEYLVKDYGTNEGKKGQMEAGQRN